MKRSGSVLALLRDDGGQGLVEYALIICFVSMLGIVAFRLIATKANSTLSGAANQLS